jgi:putative ABC transport system substrate-binding protein
MSPRYEDVRVGTFMKRREFITLVGGAASLPLAVQAQQPMPVIGFLHSAFRGPAAGQEAAFLEGLKEAGFVDGKNVSIEYRWAEGHMDRLAALAADLADRRVTAIAALGGDTTALAARQATGTIPIVFVNGSDPVRSGLVASINRPAGNVTGVSLFASAVDAKRLELLHELAPKVSVVGVLNNAFVAETETRSRALADAAKSIGVQLSFLNVDAEDDFDKTFATLANRGIGVLFVSGSPFFIIDAIDWFPLLPGNKFLRSMHGENSSKQVAWRAMEPTWLGHIVKRASISAGFSGVKNRPTCRCCSRQNSSS